MQGTESVKAIPHCFHAQRPSSRECSDRWQAAINEWEANGKQEVEGGSKNTNSITTHTSQLMLISIFLVHLLMCNEVVWSKDTCVGHGVRILREPDLEG